MTLLDIDLTSDTASGVLAAAQGALRFRPTQRRVLDDITILPIPFQVALTAGLAQVELASNDPAAWVWRIDEHVTGCKSRTIYVNIPDAEAVNYSELVPLDPSSLSPEPSPVPAWAGPLAELTERLDAGTVTPDPDHPGFYLIGA